jgi:nucleoside-diphosphate-sugar epimerase|tara:strand:+ start:16705 stop:17529 length:825 start_codon:yes stop_codon:yes gene_type:complete
MRILITGGKGFIGRNLIKALNKNYKIFSPSTTELNLISEVEVDNFFLDKQFDWVIHCAIRGGRRINNDPKNILSDNLLMFYNLMRNQSKFKFLINFTSGAELDRSNNIGDETNNPNNFFPKDYYGISKNIISRLINNNKRFFNLRIYGVFGSDEREDRFITTCIRKIKSGKKIEIFQDKQFDFFFIDDLILIVSKILNSNQSLDLNNIDLVYKDKYLLSDIAKLLLNKFNISNGIAIKDNLLGLSYSGNYESYFDNLELKGFEYGIDFMIKNVK